MKKQFTYRLFCFLVLFTVINTAVAGPVHSKDRAKQEKGLSEPAGESNVNYIDGLPEPSLCHIQEAQAGSPVASKRTQHGKDLLLIHASKLSNTVKASSGDEIRFADELTHIFLFLFPHHFFW